MGRTIAPSRSVTLVNIERPVIQEFDLSARMVARTNSDNKHNIDENQESDDRNYEATASWEVCDWMCYENDQQHKTANNGKSVQNEMDAVPGRTGTVTELLPRCFPARAPDLHERKSSYLC